MGLNFGVELSGNNDVRGGVDFFGVLACRSPFCNGSRVTVLYVLISLHWRVELVQYMPARCIC